MRSDNWNSFTVYIYGTIWSTIKPPLDIPVPLQKQHQAVVASIWILFCVTNLPSFFWCSGNFRTITKKKYDMKIIKWLIIEFIVVITRRCAWRNAFQYLNTTKSKDRKQLRNCCNIRRNWPKWSSWNLIAFFCCYWRQFNFPGQLSSWMRYSYFIRAFTVDRLKSIA